MGWSLDWAFAPTSCRREHTKPYPNRLGYISAGPSQAPRSWVQQTIIRLWGVILFSDHSKLWYYVRQRVHASIAPSTTIKKKKEEPVSVSIISNFSVRRFQIASILRRCWSFGLKGNAQSCWIGSCREVHKILQRIGYYLWSLKSTGISQSAARWLHQNYNLDAVKKHQHIMRTFYSSKITVLLHPSVIHHYPPVRNFSHFSALGLLCACRPLWSYLHRFLSDGVSYPMNPFSESDRRGSLRRALVRGYHSSVSAHAFFGSGVGGRSKRPYWNWNWKELKLHRWA